MTTGKQKHAEEVETDAVLARRLLAAQFPHWAALPLARVHTDSTDNDMYRLGADMAVRLPRRAGAATPMDKEYEWLPRLAPHLPLPVPLTRGKGVPEGDYPYPWSVVTWIEGAPPPPWLDDRVFAVDFAVFVTALHALNASTGPAPGPHNFWRGVRRERLDETLRQRFDWLSDLAEVEEVVAEWQKALLLPEWTGAPVWIHGDIQRGNVLMREGRLAGVIDWSAFGVGDPAGDLSVAWSFFGPDARAAYRAAMQVDHATWARGRAWALIEGVFALSHYRGKNEVLAEAGRRVIEAVLADR